MKEFQTDKEIFDYVRGYDLNSLRSLKERLGDYEFRFVEIDELRDLLFKEDYLLIDARSEKEFEETSIPTAINFPVLSDRERHNVGLVYKKYSDVAAVELASEYALTKMERLREFMTGYGGKNVYVYCWRGGGRSKYLSKMLFDLGYSPVTLVKGVKAYRNMVNSFFQLNSFKEQLLELNGLTGCGKTELIDAVSRSLPVLNLERCARHFSSLFGYVPYFIRGKSRVKNQCAFENNIYGEYVYNRNCHSERDTYVVESESKKVGSFSVPNMLYDVMEGAKAISIVSSMDSRVKRLTKDYFINERGFEEMIKIFTEKGKFFRQELSGVHYDSCMEALKSGKAEDFIFIMLRDYYDLKYKDKGKSPIGIVNSDDIDSAAEEIVFIYRKFCQT